MVALQTHVGTKFPRVYTDRRLGGGYEVLRGFYWLFISSLSIMKTEALYFPENLVRLQDATKDQ